MTSGHLDDRSRVVIVGAGRVGSTTAFTALIQGLAQSIVLVDVDPARAEGEAMDLVHGLPFVPPALVEAGGFEACAEADVVILTAGAARQPGDTRLDLARRNLDLYRDLVPRITATGFAGIVLVVSNPVDLLTLAVQRLSGFPAERVLGTGTILDTARLRSVLSRRFEVDARNIHAYVVGEHGESEVPAWSLARIANLTLLEFARATGRLWTCEDERRIGEEVRGAGAEVIRRKGATHYAIGLATASLARAVLRDDRSILTVSTVLQGQQGIEEIATSLPCIVGREGRLATVPLSLGEDEARALVESARVLQEAYVQAGGPPAPVSPARPG
jgi:L-lactate dehydrogenase